MLIYEVCRHLLTHSPDHVMQVHSYLQLGKVVSLNASEALQAAQAAKRFGLHLADAMIWQTAQSHGAQLYTQDAALSELPGVVYRAKE